MNYLDLLKPDSRTIVIAEAGTNHDADVNKTLRMIDVAVQSAAALASRKTTPILLVRFCEISACLFSPGVSTFTHGPHSINFSHSLFTAQSHRL